MTPWTSFKILSVVSLIALGAASACGKKEESGKAAAAEPTTTKPSTSPTTTMPSGNNPCLALQDETVDDSTGASTATGGLDQSSTTGTSTASGGTGTTGAGTTNAGTTGAGTTGAGTTGGAAGPTVGGCVNAATAGATTGANTAGGTTDGTTSTPGGTGENANLAPGPGIDGCAAQGKIWVPPSKDASGAPIAAQCGDALYEDVCCNDVANFYKAVGASTATALKAQVANASSNRVAGGGPADLLYYGCTKVGGKYGIHSAKFSYDQSGAARVDYYTMFVSYTAGGPSTVGQPTTCKAVSLADLGYKEGSGAVGGTTAGTTTGTAATSFDLSACGITQGDLAGVTQWIRTESNYTSSPAWVKDGAVRVKYANSAHGNKHKQYFSSALYTSSAGAPANHPTGSCAVEVGYNDAGTAVAEYNLMVKQAGTGPESWVFFHAAADNSGTPVFGAAETTCAGCHAGAEHGDHIRSRPVP